MQTDKEKWIAERAENAALLASEEPDSEMKAAYLALCCSLQVQAIDLALRRKQEIGLLQA